MLPMPIACRRLPRRASRTRQPPASIRARGEPWKRGGAYNKSKTQSAAGQIAKQEKEALKAERLKASEARTADQTKIAHLESQVAQLTETLKTKEAKADAEKRAAVLEATQAAAEKMLTRYRDGLRDGASLSAGRAHINLASCTPDSGIGAASPWGSTTSS